MRNTTMNEPMIESTKLPEIPVNHDFGIGTMLRRAEADLRASADLLAAYAQARTPQSDRPFVCDSRKLCILMYTEALNRVRRRFWTTSFLSSGFWSRLDDEILGANLRLLGQLRESGVVTRRLFLLPLTPEDEIERWLDERMLLRKSGDADGLARFDTRFANLLRNVEGLLAHGCDARVIHDGEERFRGLPPQLAFDCRDSELGLYDDWRIDVFRGGSAGIIASVDSFTPAMCDFASLRAGVEEYFETLWQHATPISAFLERMRQASEEMARRIDYPLVWLARYDHGLPPEDELLKAVELAIVKTELQRSARWGKIHRHLDVGTCTGRYPVSLRDAVEPDGEIVGIDSDMDCIHYARWNIQCAVQNDPRLHIERVDFCAEHSKLAGPFDLITCMLGTVIHFRRLGAVPPYDDPFQRALEKFGELLRKDGMLFLSLWTEAACRDLKMLSIYSKDEKRRLAEWTPSAAELQERLTAAGLSFEPPYQLERRMELYRCSARG
jgi:SAM-dependent methyltransferase